MNLLKRNVIAPRRRIFTALGIVALAYLVGLSNGIAVSEYDSAVFMRQACLELTGDALFKPIGTPGGFTCVYSRLDTIADWSQYGESPETPATTVIITETTISPVTCKDVMEKFDRLPSAELLEQEGLLDQVADCTLEALEEPACGIRDPLGCVSYVWHAIVH